MSQPTAITTSSQWSTDAYDFYVHAETQSERLMRLANHCADRFAWSAEGSGVFVSDLAEIADALAVIAGIVHVCENLSTYGEVRHSVAP